LEEGDGVFKNLDLAADDPETVMGRALVFHASEPKNGGRVACGVIGRRKEAVFEVPCDSCPSD